MPFDIAIGDRVTVHSEAKRFDGSLLRRERGIVVAFYERTSVPDFIGDKPIQTRAVWVYFKDHAPQSLMALIDIRDINTIESPQGVVTTVRREPRPKRIS